MPERGLVGGSPDPRAHDDEEQENSALEDAGHLVLQRLLSRSDVQRIDAASYPDRMRLIATLQACYPLPTGMPDPMAGILLQTQWQMRSGRSQLPWWSAMNASLTVWQLLALEQAGILTNVNVIDLPPMTMPSDVGEKIRAYFDARRNLYDAWRAGKLPPSGFAEAEAQLNQVLWTFHSAAIAAAEAQEGAQFRALPAGEQAFASSWANLVELLSAMNFPTDEATISTIDVALPKSIVEESDYDLVQRSELSPLNRELLRTLATLDECNEDARLIGPRGLAGVAAAFPSLSSLLRQKIEALTAPVPALRAKTSGLRSSMEKLERMLAASFQRDPL